MATTARLPGIYFENVPAAQPALLPRMDIAAFAGFLPSGPIGIPFAVEDPDRFQDVFGTDLALAWDSLLNQVLLAQTPPAVRTFFRNGGQRCWVLRLAKGALSNAWTIPGLLQIDQAGIHAGWALARSEGSWSDELTVNATLLESPLPPQASGWPGTGALPQPLVLNPGDLAQLFFPASQTLAYFDYSSSQWHWFEPALASAGSPPAGLPHNVFSLGAGVDTPVPFLSFGIQQSELMLGVSRATVSAIPPGSWLRLTFGSQTMLAQVEGIEPGVGTSGSPPADETATVTSTLAWWVMDPATAWAANRGQSFQASVVTFELWAWPQGAPAQQISGLGFSQENPFCWGLLPTDAALYAPPAGSAAVPYAALASEIDNPRFPLAGPTRLGLGIPLGMTALVNPDLTQGATLPGSTALDRDGLSVFDQTLFLDPELAGMTSATLLPQAFYVQYQAQNPRPLQGIHGLLGTDEISMIAVPDAVHSGWQLAPAETPTLAAPHHARVSTPDESGNYTVSWRVVTGASGYTLNESTDPQFANSVTPRDAGAALAITLSNNAQCPLVLYYRVSAYGSAGLGPWSKTVQIELGTGDFTPCSTPTLAAPELEIYPPASMRLSPASATSNRVVLSWGPAAELADSFTLQTAGDPLFESPVPLYQGQDSTFTYWITPGPPSYFRVSVQRGGVSSPWSNTVNTTPEPPSPWSVISGPPPVLLAVHTAMLVMAGARGDQVSILSLPYSFRTADATAYQTQLQSIIGTAHDPLPTLPSYGALYHPWIVTPDTTSQAPQSLRTLVPDGAVCGVIASTTLASGAWIAAANEQVTNAVALAPPLDNGAALAFAAAQINLIAQQPDGFMITAQYTLMIGGAPDLQALNVRRLLILLRRLALQEGVRYVFQNNSASLQRSVTRQFQQWMKLLLARGAFAGTSAQDSYQVIADSTVNTQDSMDQGRFVVQLLVAPSVPMRFLTVKLVQSGGQLALVEG